MNNKKPRLRVWLLKMQRVEQQNLLRADQKRRQMMRLRLTMVKLHVLLQRHWPRNKRLMLLPRNKLRRLQKQLVSKRIVSPRKPRLLVYNLLRTNKRPHVLLPRKQPELLLKMKLIELLRK